VSSGWDVKPYYTHTHSTPLQYQATNRCMGADAAAINDDGDDGGCDAIPAVGLTMPPFV